MASLLNCFKSLLAITLILVTVALAPAEAIDAPKFLKKKAKIAGVAVTLEIADTDEKLEYGLMNRSSLDKNSGMLFVFDSESTRHFWMKNTFVDLSIAFLNSKYEVIDIQEMKAMKSVMDQDIKTYVSAGPAKYAIEMNKGWFKKNRIKTGSKLDISQ